MTFRTTLLQNSKTATGFVVPPEVVEGLGAGKRPPVVVTLNGKYKYRNTVAVMGGKFMIGVSAEHRAGAGVKGGETIAVSVALDTAPREVVVPKDLAAALAKDAKARAAFEKLSYSHKRQHTLAIEGAKADETRARRVAKAIEMLRTPRPAR